MICVECGKKSDIINNGLCLNCYVKSKKFSKGPDFINIIKCSNCGTYKIKNKWEKDSFKNIIQNNILNNFNISEQLKNIKISTKIIDDTNLYKKKLQVEIKGFISNLEINENHEINVNIKREICDVCSKQFGGYHEAIIQVRAEKRKLVSKEIDGIFKFVEEYIEKIQDKGNNSVFITDFELKENGLNFYISDNNIAFTITQKLQELYPGVVTKSSKNIGMKDGKQIYRMTYLLRLYQYTKEDIISNKEKFYFVKKISKNKITLADLETWDENIYNARELNTFIVKGGDDLKKNVILLSQTKNDVQIMDQDNYKIYIIRKPKSIVFNEKIIKIIMIEDKLYLSPII